LAERARMKPETDAFFISERRGPLSRKTVWFMIGRYGELAGLPVEAHPHMLRHACGFALADQGADTRLIQDYLGHRNIQHTVKYTATNPARFERLWRGEPPGALTTGMLLVQLGNWPSDNILREKCSRQ